MEEIDRTAGPDERVKTFSGRRLSWQERMELVRKEFPSVDSLDWKKAMDVDEDLLVRIMRDVLKVDQAVPGRPGPRPALEYDKGMDSLKRLMGQDFSIMPFREAFAGLCQGLSLAQVARKTGLSRSQVYRLQKGEISADFGTMAQIATGFRKHPSYFAEYRTYYVLAFMQDRLMQAPEWTIDYYRKMTKGV